MSNMQSQIKIQSKLSSPFIIHKGIQQGDALAFLLFNITLEYAIIKSDIQTRDTIFYKSVQFMAYSDDILIIGRSLASLKKAFQLLNRQVRTWDQVSMKAKLNIWWQKTPRIAASPAPLKQEDTTLKEVIALHILVHW